MLLKKDSNDKSKSEYCCDRCKAKLNNDTRVGIYTATTYQKVKKRWDLCRKCYKSLVIGIRGKNKRQENKNEI